MVTGIASICSTLQHGSCILRDRTSLSSTICKCLRIFLLSKTSDVLHQVEGSVSAAGGEKFGKRKTNGEKSGDTVFRLLDSSAELANVCAYINRMSGGTLLFRFAE